MRHAAQNRNVKLPGSKVKLVTPREIVTGGDTVRGSFPTVDFYFRRGKGRAEGDNNYRGRLNASSSSPGTIS